MRDGMAEKGAELSTKIIADLGPTSKALLLHTAEPRQTVA